MCVNGHVKNYVYFFFDKMCLGYKRNFVTLVVVQSIILGFVCFKLYSTSIKNRQGVDIRIHNYHNVGVEQTELKFIDVNHINTGMLDDSENGDSERNETIHQSIYRDVTNSKTHDDMMDVNNPGNVHRHLSNVTEANGDVCQPKIPQLSQIQRPKIALASFMGSGNTWTRHFIQQISGNKFVSPISKMLFIADLLIS